VDVPESGSPSVNLVPTRAVEGSLSHSFANLVVIPRGEVM